ncbi:MAG TPA: TerB family tellurite resistance protein [Kofleriaceae bacterium]|nr:TerB family tellurite resistance protein [Kofleriaceae bacterium]
MASPELDRTSAICDLLLGAAHADSHFHDQERDRVRELLGELHGADELPAELEARIDAFDPAGFDIASASSGFRADPVEERRKLLHLVAAIHEADEELDLDEDEYLRELAGALDLPAEELSGLALEFEVEELRDSFTRLRATPPPIPAAARSKKKAADGDAGDGVDVDLDE